MPLPAPSQARAVLVKLIEDPYGEGTLPEKVKSSEQAAEVAHSGKSHYEVLHAHRGATPAEIKACYKRMALMLHPDKNPHETAAAAFKKVPPDDLHRLPPPSTAFHRLPPPSTAFHGPSTALDGLACRLVCA